MVLVFPHVEIPLTYEVEGDGPDERGVAGLAVCQTLQLRPVTVPRQAGQLQRGHHEALLGPGRADHGGGRVEGHVTTCPGKYREGVACRRIMIDTRQTLR